MIKRIAFVCRNPSLSADEFHARWRGPHAELFAKNSAVTDHVLRYEQNHRLTRPQRRALRAISLCRTPALGGHLDQCTHCGFRHMVWHSCRNRHCPRCQAEARKRWLDERRQELLPVSYFHVVFTVPESLNAFALAGPRQFYDILFAATRETLLVIAADPKHLGAKIGALAVLHRVRFRSTCSFRTPDPAP